MIRSHAHAYLMAALVAVDSTLVIAAGLFTAVAVATFA